MCRRMGDQESFPAPPDTAGVDRVDERLTELSSIHPSLLAVRARVVEQASELRAGHGARIHLVAAQAESAEEPAP